MIAKERQNLITGQEFGDERRRLMSAGFGYDSPELKHLWDRVDDRDDYLWHKYAEPLIASQNGQWAAVSTDGDVIIFSTASDAISEATDRFGAGNFVYGKLANFRGHIGV